MALTEIEELIATAVKTGYLYLRPVLDERQELAWQGTYEYQPGGVGWQQVRVQEESLALALSRCLRPSEPSVILGMPLTTETEETMRSPTLTLSPPRNWHLPTRLRSLANSGAPLTELLKGVECHFCARQRDPQDLTIAWNLELVCRTDTGNCIHPPTGKKATPPQYVSASAVVDSPPERRVEPVQKVTNPGEGRVFTCKVCGKKKRTQSTRGRLPEVCKACKKEAAK